MNYKKILRKLKKFFSDGRDCFSCEFAGESATLCGECQAWSSLYMKKRVRIMGGIGKRYEK